MEDYKFEACTVASTRMKTTADKLAPLLAAQVIKLLVSSTEQKKKATGPLFVIYHGVRDVEGELDVEFCLPIDAKLDKEEGGITCREVDGFSGKSVVVKGSYDKLQEGHEKLKSKDGAVHCVEIFVKGPRETKKPDEYETRIVVAK